MKRPRSLKSRALQLLAQREQSRVELRRKLLAHARAEAAACRSHVTAEVLQAPAIGSGVASPAALRPAAAQALSQVRSCPDDFPAASGDRYPDVAPADLEAQVDAVLAWLEANRFLSAERFAESRMHARTGRFGNLRIRHELAQHQVTLSDAAQQALVDSELDRARAVRLRKFSGAPESAEERARQARFLAGRGFSADVIHRVLRLACRPEDDDA